jgi:hypothetical protein
MNLTTLALAAILVAGGIAGAAKAGAVLIERIHLQAAAADAMVDAVKAGTAPALPADPAPTAAQLQAQSDAELIRLIALTH